MEDYFMNFTIKCNECQNLVANSNNVLSRHVKKYHNMLWVEYIVKYEYQGIHPKCKCGCGKDLIWHKGGFPNYISGHSSKGKNNPMHGLKGRNNPNYGKKRTKKHKEKYSKAAVLRVKNNNLGSGYPYETSWYLNKYNDTYEFMHSSWEKIFLDWNYFNNKPMITKKHSIEISYMYEGVDRIYIPDFLDVKNKIIYEVKGYKKRIDIVKKMYADAWCKLNNYQYIMIEKKDIKEMKNNLLEKGIYR